jgi:pimeloyl-ACP methyl ester carboxylesterase
MTLGAAGYYAVAFDARGHGDSDWASDGNYSRDAMIRDVQYLVSALGGRRPALVGASMGGAVSLVSVGEGLVDARALILVDIAPRTEPIGGIKIREFISRNVQGFCSLEEVAEAIDSYRPRQGHPRKLETLAKNVRLGADGKYYWHWDPQLMARAPDSSERLVESARRLALPTLLVRGGHSDLVSDEGVRDFLCLSPHSEYVNVVQAGHMVAREKNDVFERAVVEFLQRMVPASSAALPSKPS